MRWKVQGFVEEDLARIGQFFKKQFRGGGEYGSEELFRWKILTNYNKRGIINLVKDGSSIASTTSLTPKTLYFKGAPVTAGEIGDTYTDESYQRQGMFALLVNQTSKEGQEQGIEFIYGTPNNQSLPGYEKKTNFKQISDLKLKSLSYFFDVTPYLERRISNIVSRPLGTVFNTFMRLNLKLRQKFSSQRYQIVQSEEFSQNWETFWQLCKPHYVNIFDRSLRAMNWRYLNNPNSYQFIFIYKDQKLYGYLSYRVIADGAVSTLVIVDYLSLPGHQSAIDAGIGWILCNNANSKLYKALVWCPEDHPCYSVFKRHGFLPGANVPVICYQNEKAQEICKKGLWHFTIGDSDNI